MSTVANQTNLYTASNQWASRPPDQRFWGLNDLYDNLTEQRRRSHEDVVSGNRLRVQSTGHDENGDGGSLSMVGHNGMPINFTNWSFGQLCNYAGAPASYLRELPPSLVAKNLNHGLAKYDEHTANCLMQSSKHGDKFTLRALATEKYGRLWNNELVMALKANAVQNGWRVPPARPSVDDERARPATAEDILPNQGNFGLRVKVGDMIAPASVYKSDRDMFIFMVHPDRVIDDGGEGLMRGFFLFNSEVGAGAFKIQAFYLENVCGNAICWGVSNVKTLRVVHKKGAIAGLRDKMRRQLDGFAMQDTGTEERMIAVARRHELGSNRAEVVDTLYNNKSLGLSKGDIEASFTVAEKWEHTALCAPTTAYGFVHGMTRYSQEKIHTDARVKLDTAGGKILELAAKSAGVNTARMALPAPR